MLSISATTVIEGNDAAFRVTLSPAQAQEVRVSYATSDVTANATSDYTATNGTVIFAPGETLKTIIVSTIADKIAEPEESFTLTLTHAINAVIGTREAAAVIVDDDVTRFRAVRH